MDEQKPKDKLLDDAISLYTGGQPDKAIVILEGLVKRYPDDIELKDTLNTIKAEVHDLTAEAVNGSEAPQPEPETAEVAEIKEHSRKKIRLALGIFILLVVIITGLWGFTKVLSSYQNSGTGAYRLLEEKKKEANADEYEVAKPASPTVGKTDPLEVEKNGEEPESPDVDDPSKPPSDTPTESPTPPADIPIEVIITPPPPEAPPETPPVKEEPPPTKKGKGYLKVSPAPPTMVYVNGVMKGNSQRLGRITLTEGNHKVTLVSQQYGSRSLSIAIDEGKTTNIAFPY